MHTRTQVCTRENKRVLGYVYEDEEGRCKATWKREFTLSWREAVPPNHHDDKVDSDQTRPMPHPPGRGPRTSCSLRTGVGERE